MVAGPRKEPLKDQTNPKGQTNPSTVVGEPVEPVSTGLSTISPTEIVSTTVQSALDDLESSVARSVVLIQQLGLKTQQQPNVDGLSELQAQKMQAIFIASLAPVITVLFKQTEKITSHFQYLATLPVPSFSFEFIQDKSIDFSNNMYLMTMLFSEINELKSVAPSTSLNFSERLAGLQSSPSLAILLGEIDQLNNLINTLNKTWSEIFSESNSVLFTFQQESVSSMTDLIESAVQNSKQSVFVDE